MQHVFGPVPSRRLGHSLGIDPLPLKTCNWNCVYCQLGRTCPLATERRSFVPVQEILEEAEAALSGHREDEIDWVTIVGSGEPTLHAEIGALISGLKRLSDRPLAVITNGSLLYLPEVRASLALADAVLPSLDVGTPDLFRRLNRPHSTFNFTRQVFGLAAFRKAYAGSLWVEVMLVRGLNDSEAELRALAGVLRAIRPDEIHLMRPTRPSCEAWVASPDETSMMSARLILGTVAPLVEPEEAASAVLDEDHALETILGVIVRHPLWEDELLRWLRASLPGQEDEMLSRIEASSAVQVGERLGQRFWSAPTASYVSSRSPRDRGDAQ